MFMGNTQFSCSVSNSINNYEFSGSININDTKFPYAYLSKRSMFLIKPPLQQQQQQPDQTLLRPWFVRITQNSTGKTKIFQPETEYDSIFRAFHYSNMLDFNELSVLHIGTDFIIDNDDFIFPFQHADDYLIPCTVLAVTSHGKKPLVVGTLCFVTPRPMLFRGNDERWMPIYSSTYYGDICVFKGRIYASELSLPKGNCVVFMDDSVLCIGNVSDGNYVFHLDQDKLSPISEYPEYLNLFYPPEWILKR